MSRYCTRNMSPVVVIITLLMMIIVTPTTLQPSLATGNNTGDTIDALSSNTITYVPSNQSTSTLADKTNVTLRGLFNTADPGARNWDRLLQPGLDELNRRHPDMNIELEYIEFTYDETRNQILNRLSNGDPVDIISVDQIWLGEFEIGRAHV